MKWMYLLPLLLTAVLCEKRLNLREIRGDHHQRVENRGKKPPTSDELRAGESKYSAKAEVAQQYYAPTAAATAATATASAGTAAPQELGNQVGDYAELQSYESFKYASGNQQQDYTQVNEDPSAYLQQSPLATSAAEQHQHQQQQQQHTPQQYYIQEGRSHSQNGYDVSQEQQQQQQQLYQQEVLVGNQLQSVQQKTAAQKYIDGSDAKGIYYINIPMSQLLAYYQNYGLVQSRSKNAEQQVPIPLYTPTLTQNQVYASAKVTYQPKVQYVSTHQKHTQAAKSSSPLTVLHAAQPATASVPIHQVPAESHQQYTGPVELLSSPNYESTYHPQRYQYQYVTIQQPQSQQYTHQYQQQQQQQQYQQQQHQQQQQIVYENTPNSYQADTYNEPATAYEQDNLLYEQQQQYQPQSKPQQYYVPTGVSEQLTSQLLHQTNLQNSVETVHPQSIKQEQLEPLHADFTPPQYQAQRFRASQEVTHLVPVSNEHAEGFPSKSTYSSASRSPQPKSLLDTYVPSHVIAAQDSHRYRERPIKLESGFLPSKINFVGYKKRKTE